MPIKWLPENAIIAIHGELMAEHGGLAGPADSKLLSATPARPQHLQTYSNPAPTLFQFAASYGYGFAKNNCFKDGKNAYPWYPLTFFFL